MAYLLLTLLAVVIVGVLVVTGQWIGDKRDAEKKALKARVSGAERALDKTEHYLRSIANGSSNPVLEAQIALDEITNYHEKELN